MFATVLADMLSKRWVVDKPLILLVILLGRGRKLYPVAGYMPAIFLAAVMFAIIVAIMLAAMVDIMVVDIFLAKVLAVLRLGLFKGLCGTMATTSTLMDTMVVILPTPLNVSNGTMVYTQTV
jgi:small basic protein